MRLSNLTCTGLLVTKSSIQLQREVLMPKSPSLLISLEGMMVLNAKLNDEQHSHIGVTVVWVECSAVGMASSV